MCSSVSPASSPIDGGSHVRLLPSRKRLCNDLRPPKSWGSDASWLLLKYSSSRLLSSVKLSGRAVSKFPLKARWRNKDIEDMLGGSILSLLPCISMERILGNSRMPEGKCSKVWQTTAMLSNSCNLAMLSGSFDKGLFCEEHDGTAGSSKPSRSGNNSKRRSRSERSSSNAEKLSALASSSSNGSGETTTVTSVSGDHTSIESSLSTASPQSSVILVSSMESRSATKLFASARLTTPPSPSMAAAPDKN
mmetsp:Transcript_44919/g.82010  ORF Transcript_44919/g.82010 Transcript_44919/m.82010 type:complete len:249 (-) Transcript_44919:60-806(-)